MTRKFRTKMPPSKTLSRKERRKEERKLKKARKDAFAHRDFKLIKSLKNVDSAFKAKMEEKKEQRLKLKKEKKTVEKKEEVKEKQDSRIEGLKLAIQKDEKELKQLEKNLKFRKKKGKKNLPSSFMKDGLDYILDVTDADKIKTLEDVGTGYVKDSDDSDSESEFDDSEQGSESEVETDTNLQSPKSAAFKGETKSQVGKKTEKEDGKKGKTAISTGKKVTFALKEAAHSDGDSEGLDSDEDAVLNSDEDIEEDDSDLDEPMESDEDLETEKPPRKRPRTEEDLKEDIYGRLRDKEGNIVKPSAPGAYVPPAKRALMSGSHNEMLHKRLKGLVNKVSEGTIQAISSQVESLYLDNSRADVNETLTSLIMEAVVTPVLSPERLVAELAMLVAILYNNVGSEVGAFVLQKLAKKFDTLLSEPQYGMGKQMENVLLLIANIYNFKVIHCKLMFNIIEKFIAHFGERDIELLLQILKTVGFNLRKDDPAKLKQVILDIQAKAKAAESSGGEGMQSRIKFMLDILMAVRNNNMRKIPNCDNSHIEHLKKIIKNFIRAQSLGDDQLNISLEDLLKADQVGRWWIVGSAWEGRKDTDSVKDAKSRTETSVTGTFSKQMLKLAKQQGMNTDIRRNIFCILGTSEDFEDAFARLLRLGLNRTQEREIIHVLMHCCMNEKEYNPFYSFLAQKLCLFDRRFMITVQFSMWDKFKGIDSMDKLSRVKLGHLLSHLLLTKALSISIFKVIDFGMESKKIIRFLTQVLTEILTSSNEATVIEMFERIAPFPKLKTLRQGLQVFMRIHLKDSKDKGQGGLLLLERIEKAEAAMFSHQTSNMLL
ncbi:nucleolar MIF4G domain-containing protein 1-like [Physella acuta]|uniref:nucleolar MIF4G domain-containing protein 1-like n=1 Tax=Physella acuta TaxID=109671 RepID=UPI0027DB619C|nr:nucleolar MIF4G domain-containing protein 1-like [Physella acuta]XP_059152515.1 nucleolar MIF4G domain-containing protein 1-like [Physella acuta]XP_059152516.1 nucleolar MIF4G domain-containing protein 1-like [Physella acuta]